MGSTAVAPELAQHLQVGDAVLTRAKIARVVAALALAIDDHYQKLEEPLVLLPVLKGALYFASDLSRELLTPHKLEFVTYRSYESELRTDGYFAGLDGEALKALFEAVRGSHVLVVDEIVDTGSTVEAIRKLVADYQPASVETAALIVRGNPDAETLATAPRFSGFYYPHKDFLFGYGLDLNGSYRHLQAVYSSASTSATIEPSS